MHYFFSIKSQWNNECDITLLKEILKVNPFQYKVGTVLRGKAWVSITEVFAIPLSTRFIRERYTLLKSKFSKRMRFEESASGINPDYSEVDILMQDDIDFETSQNDINLHNKENQKKNDIKKQKQAENMRLKCMENLCETQKREGKGVKRSRNESSNVIIKYLNEKNEKVSESKIRDLKEKEIKLREQELQQQKQQHQEQMEFQKSMFHQMQKQQADLMKMFMEKMHEK